MPDEPAREPQGKGLKGTLARKIGPLPTWVWIVIAAALILGWVWLRAGKSQQQAGPSDTAGTGQVPQFVNQTFVSPSPPAAADQDNDEDQDQEPVSHPVKTLPPHPKPPPPRPRPPWGEGGRPGREHPPWGRGEPRRRRRRRRHEMAGAGG